MGLINSVHKPLFLIRIGGFDYFAEAYPDAKVYAHKTLQGYMQQLLNVRNKITQKRAVFQFGTELSDKEHENSDLTSKEIEPHCGFH